MLGDPYAAPEELAERMGGRYAGSYVGLIDAASRRVESFAGRQFNRTETATERRFRALDIERLVVDDFYTTTGLVVVVDGVTWASDDYDIRPWDGVFNGQTGWPYFELIAINRVWPLSRRAVIKVTAKWGWSAVPEGIAESTLRVAKWMADGGTQPGLVSSESEEGYSVTYALPSAGGGTSVPAELMPAFPYRRKRFGVA